MQSVLCASSIIVSGVEGRVEWVREKINFRFSDFFYLVFVSFLCLLCVSVKLSLEVVVERREVQTQRETRRADAQ